MQVAQGVSAVPVETMLKPAVQVHRLTISGPDALEQRKNVSDRGTLTLKKQRAVFDPGFQT